MHPGRSAAQSREGTQSTDPAKRSAPFDSVRTSSGLRSGCLLPPNGTTPIKRRAATTIPPAFAALAIGLTLTLASPALVAAQVAATRLVVSPRGPYTTIQAALEAARAGDTIQVERGHYQGPVVVQKQVTLEGIDFPVIDNGGQGTVVTLAAAGAALRGFELRGSGGEPDQDHSGVIAAAPRVTVESNRLTDVLFGIFVSQAPDAVVRGNEITSKAEFEIGRKGDAIRLWSSPRTLVENNHVYNARDVVIWYSSGVLVRGNTVERGRYGIHLMYCDGSRIERNMILDNSVGIYTMYSNDITLRENLIRGQRGPSGYALGFKDSDNVEVGGNVLVDNRAGMYIDGMPFSPQGYGRIRDNIIAFNDVAAILLPAVRGNTIEHNTFWENVQQVAVQGGGSLGANKFQGNYWSDYAGVDMNGDGIGDVPYRAEDIFEGLTDREPMLRMLIYSPAQQAIEFTSSAFPVMRPKLKFSDPAPSVSPLPLPAFAAQRPGSASGMSLAAVALLGSSGVLGMLAMKKTKGTLPLVENASQSGRGSTASLPAAPAAGVDSVGSSDERSRHPDRSAERTEFVMHPERSAAESREGTQSKEPAERSAPFDYLLASLGVRSGCSLPPDSTKPEAAHGDNIRTSICVCSVTKRYGKAEALDGVSFKVPAGESLALWGPNGAGKTTLLKAILGLIDFQGDIRIKEHDVKRNPKSARRHIGYVPQEAVFYDLSVEATMAFYARLKHVDLACATALLERVALDGHAHKPVPALSGGLKQRLALAIALLADPSILLLDEPTANLDSLARRDYLELLAGLHHEGKTIVFASHRIEEVQALADRVLVLRDGSLDKILTPEQLRAALAPEIQMTLWVAESERIKALARLQRDGVRAHANGRGTIVVRLSSGDKMAPLHALREEGISIVDFEVEGLSTWS